MNETLKVQSVKFIFFSLGFFIKLIFVCISLHKHDGGFFTGVFLSIFAVIIDEWCANLLCFPPVRRLRTVKSAYFYVAFDFGSIIFFW